MKDFISKRRVPTTVSLPMGLLYRVQEMAGERQFSAVVRSLLEKWLAEQEKKNV